MPTNEQRRATAKRKLERQLERRAAQARRRRLFTIIGSAVAVVVVVVAVVATVLLTSSDSDTEHAGGAPDTPPTHRRRRRAALPRRQLPAFKAPADLGKNCQYPAAQAASKPNKPPRTGKVPTDPAEVSVSMSTNQGNIGIQLDNAKSPCTVNSFASLAQQNYFNDTQCHRLTTSPGLSVLQCGDPTGQGTGGPGYEFANEYPTNQYQPDDPQLQNPVIYPRGTLAMANAGPGHQRQPVLPGLQGLAAAARLHGVRHDRRHRPGDAGQDRRGGRGRRRARTASRRTTVTSQIDRPGLRSHDAARAAAVRRTIRRRTTRTAIHGRGRRTAWRSRR